MSKPFYGEDIPSEFKKFHVTKFEIFENDYNRIIESIEKHMHSKKYLRQLFYLEEGERTYLKIVSYAYDIDNLLVGCIYNFCRDLESSLDRTETVVAGKKPAGLEPDLTIISKIEDIENHKIAALHDEYMDRYRHDNPSYLVLSVKRDEATELIADFYFSRRVGDISDQLADERYLTIIEHLIK